MLNGVDVSEHNGLWAIGAPPPDFAILRACYGTRKDLRHDAHFARFKSLGVPVGAYAFGVYGDGATQAKAFLLIAKNAALIALDLETESGRPRMTDLQAKAFIAECHRQNRKVGLYHSRSGFPTLNQDWNWVAQYSPTLTKPYPAMTFAIWQWQGSPIDRDRFYGTKAQLIALGAPYLKPAPVPPPPPAPTPPPKPTTDPYGNPYTPDDFEYTIWMHDHGYVQVGGVWQKVGGPIPPPIPPPPAPPPVVTPPPPAAIFPATPTQVDAISSPYTWLTPTKVTLNGLPGFRVGTSGTLFVYVHGGPQPVTDGGDLLSPAQRIAAAGGQAFTIEYRSQDPATRQVDWRMAVSDIKAAIADVRKLVPGVKVTLVSHSFGGFPCSIVALMEGAVDAYVAVNAICSSAGVGAESRVGAPDIIGMAKLRPTLPVSIIEGMSGPVPPADDKAGFAAALRAGGHPGFWTQGPGDHTGTLMCEATTEYIMKTAKLA